MTVYGTIEGGQFIAGRYCEGRGDTFTTVVNPANDQVLVRFPAASSDDVDAAMTAAQDAFGDWSRATPGERATVIHALAVRMRVIAEELAQAETAQAGKPIRLSREFDVPGTIDNADFFAGSARHLEGAASAEYSGQHTSSIRREPLGVIASIAPWNYPLQMAGWKILPAIAAGNTIVLKPAEVTPLTSLMLAQAAVEAGVPAGVINVLNGPGRSVGAAMMRHAVPRMVSFTGSTSVGKGIATTAAETVKRVHLELGGKAPFVVFDDADLEAAIRGAVAGSLINTGQDCTAATRAYVHRAYYSDFLDGVARLMETVRLGEPTDPDTDLGPLISRRQQESVSAIVERARNTGAKVVTGGSVPGGSLKHGAYYEPTLIADASQDSEIMQTEIFGPVLVVHPFDSDDEAINLANDTPFGLAASAWTSNILRAQRASREIQAGCVWINDHIPMASEMPHGGYKQSGYGKDMSKYSFDEYTNVKHVMSEITGEARKPWHSTIFRG
jgi:betaine-aldehyde dehydrogenase